MIIGAATGHPLKGIDIRISTGSLEMLKSLGEIIHEKSVPFPIQL